MENQKLIEYRLTTLEKQMIAHEKKIENLDDSLQQIINVPNDRYREITNLNVKLNEGYKAQKELIKSLSESIDVLIHKVDDLRETYRNDKNEIDSQFKDINNQINFQDKHEPIKTAVDKADKEDTASMSKTTLGTITVGIIGIIEVFVQYVAPNLFK